MSCFMALPSLLRGYFCGCFEIGAFDLAIQHAEPRHMAWPAGRCWKKSLRDIGSAFRQLPIVRPELDAYYQVEGYSRPVTSAKTFRHSFRPKVPIFLVDAFSLCRAGRQFRRVSRCRATVGRAVISTPPYCARQSGRWKPVVKFSRSWEARGATTANSTIKIKPE